MPVATAMYSWPRCACLACSDLPPPDDLDALYRHPTTTTWRHDDNDDVYYNSNDVDRPRRGCSCFGGTMPACSAGQPLRQPDQRTLPCMLQPRIYG